jgi:hypothetical protein
MAQFSGPIPPGMAGMMGGGGAPGGAPPGPPGMPAPGGPQLPPGLMAGAPGAGPMTVPQGNPGNSLAAISNLKTALMLLQQALPAIPLGSDVHSDILKAVGMLAKHADNQQTTDQSQITQLQAMIQKLAQQQPNAALARLGQMNPNAPPALPQPPAPSGGPPGSGGPPDAGGPPDSQMAA